MVRTIPGLLGLILLVAPLSGGPVSEYELKAAYLYNFLRYATFPESSFASKDTPIEVAVLGRNPFGEYLNSLTKRTCQGRTITVRHCNRPSEAASAQLVFVATANSADLLEVAAREFAGKPVILVSEAGSPLAEHSHIVLALESERLRFDVHQAAVRASGITFSSRMLALAREVYR